MKIFMKRYVKYVFAINKNYMKDALYGTQLHINFSFLKNNIAYLKQQIGHNNIIAMVKANAYGHGDILISQKMQEFGIKYFGVADFDEGIRLRKNGINQSIMVMNPGDQNIHTIINHGLEPVVYNHAILNSLIQSIRLLNPVKSQKIPIHIKINTGMNRWGFIYSELKELITKIKLQQNIKIVSIYSHLSSAENLNDDVFTFSQIKKITSVKNLFNNNFNYDIKTHILNSAAILRPLCIDFEFDFVRVGMLLYGGVEHKKIQPISELSCPISDIRIIHPSDSVGYKRAYIAKKKIKIGIIPFGYADGLQRSWGNGKLNFSYNKQMVPTIGNISMDSCVVDLTDIQNIDIGDKIVYFGCERPIWDLARELNTIPYEIVSTLSQRIKRVYSE